MLTCCRSPRTIAVISCVGAFGLLACAAYLTLESMHARRDAVVQVRPGMTGGQVYDLLGALYDRCPRGQYTDVDAVISRLPGSDTITHVCYYRVAYSRNRFWIGYDAQNRVVGTFLE